MWRKQNPLDADITRENCAAMGIPQYFDVIQTPMNLQLINVSERREGGREGGRGKRQKWQKKSKKYITHTLLPPFPPSAQDP